MPLAATWRWCGTVDGHGRRTGPILPPVEKSSSG